jgi:hypothetical protein
VKRPVGRRQVLVAAATAALAPLGIKLARAGTVFTPAGATERLHSTAATSSSAARTAPRGSIARIGRAYLQQYPDEANRDALVAALPKGFASGDAHWSDLLDQVRRDYASGSVVTLDGWELSRTEARASALTTLPAGG